MSEPKKHGMIESIEHYIDLFSGEAIRKSWKYVRKTFGTNLAVNILSLFLQSL